MTIYETINLILQSNALLLTVVSLFVTLIVYGNKKK